MANPLPRLCVIILAGVASVHAADNEHGWSGFRKEVISPLSVVTSAASAGIQQWRNTPHEWGQGWGAYGQRFGATLGRHAIKGAILFGVSEGRHELRRYQRSNLTGTWPRVRHAIVRTWWVPRTDGSGDTVAIGRITGNFGSAAISRAWQPPSTRTVRSAIGVGFASAGFDTGFNIIREFWPWKKWKP